MKSLIVALAICLLPSTLLASDWRDTDTAYEIVYLALDAVDLSTTWSVTKNDGTYEVNPILGQHPTPIRLVSTVVVTAALHYITARVLPPELRDHFYRASIGVKWGMVDHNQWVDQGKDRGWHAEVSYVF